MTIQEQKAYFASQRGQGPIQGKALEETEKFFKRNNITSLRDHSWYGHVVDWGSRCSGTKSGLRSSMHCISSLTSGGLSEAQPFRVFKSKSGKSLHLHGDLFGVKFTSSKTCTNAMYNHGYGTIYEPIREKWSLFPNSMGSIPLRRSVRRRFGVVRFEQLPIAIQNVLKIWIEKSPSI